MGGIGGITVEIEIQARDLDHEYETLRLGINVPVDADTLAAAVPAALAQAALTAAGRLGQSRDVLWALRDELDEMLGEPEGTEG